MFEPSLHWVRGIEPHKLALMPRPRGAEWLGDEIRGWRQAGVSSVLSLLEPLEVRELELKAEPSLCAAEGITFRLFPVPDRGTPSSHRDLEKLVTEVHAELLRGEAVVVHCRAGIGRTGLVAACLLHTLQVPFGQIFQMLGSSRGVAVPDTDDQIEWVKKYAHHFPAGG